MVIVTESSVSGCVCVGGAGRRMLSELLKRSVQWSTAIFALKKYRRFIYFLKILMICIRYT